MKTTLNFTNCYRYENGHRNAWININYPTRVEV